MNDTKLTVEEINATLLKIRQHEQVIAAAKSKRDQSVVYFKQLINNANHVFELETKEDAIEIELLKQKLKSYFDACPPKGRKSYSFAAGSFGYNKAQTEYYFNGTKVNADNKDFARFCVESGRAQFIKVKEYLDWAAVKKSLDFDDPNAVVFADTSEIVDGLRAEKIFSVNTSLEVSPS